MNEIEKLIKETEDIPKKEIGEVKQEIAIKEPKEQNVPGSPIKKIKEYQEENNKKLKNIGLRLVNNKKYNFMWVALITLSTIMLLGIVVTGNILKEKDFSTDLTNNIYPANVSVPVEVTDADTNNYNINNYYNQTIVNNITIKYPEVNSS